MKIGFVSADWTDAFGPLVPAGSTWYRCILPGRQIEAQGVSVAFCEQAGYDENGISVLDINGVEHDDCDIIVFQRVMNDFVLDMIDAGRKAGQIIINDIDDWYWGVHDSNRAKNALSKELNPTCNIDIYKEALKRSHLVTCSTPFLAQEIAKWGVQTEVLRNCIDMDRWKPKDGSRLETYGWVGATSHRSNDLQVLPKYLKVFLKKNNLKFHHSGHSSINTPIDKELNLPSYLCEREAMASIFDYPKLFNQIDVGVIPLNLIDFNEAKSNIKGLEMAAAGIPFIASPTSEYRLLARNGIGKIAQNEQEWINGLNFFLDEEMRIEQVKFQLENLFQFDIKVNAWKWMEIYDSLA